MSGDTAIRRNYTVVPYGIVFSYLGDSDWYYAVVGVNLIDFF